MQTIRKSLRGEQVRWRIWFWTACEVFVLYSTLRSLHSEIVSDALVCLLVGIGVAVPYILEGFGYRMSDTLFVFSLLYLLASMSGRIYSCTILWRIGISCCIYAAAWFSRCLVPISRC